MPGYDRRSYLNFLTQNKDREMVKVLTGMRGCGKTALLESFMHRLAEEGVPAGRILAFDLSDPAVRRLFPAENLLRCIMSQCPPGAPAYIFLDEVQELPDFERLADMLFRIRNYDIYLAGSGLSCELRRLLQVLPGRCAVKTVYPLSFQEMCSASGQTADADSLMAYAEQSSFPGVWRRDDPRREIDPIVSAALFHEVLSDPAIRHGLLLKILRYLSPRVGDLLSMAQMGKDTGRAGRPLLAKTLAAYISKLEESGLLLTMPLTAGSKEDQKKTPPRAMRFFFPDAAMMTLWGQGDHLPYRQLFNAVAVEMFRRFHKVSAMNGPEGPVDFVTENLSIRTAWQFIPNSKAPYAKPKWDTLKGLPDAWRKRVLTFYPEDFPASPDVIVYPLFPWFAGERRDIF